MSVLLLCANAAEAARYPAWDCVSVHDWNRLYGRRLGAVFATPRARSMPDFLVAAAVAVGGVAKMVETTYALPQVFMVGGEIPSDLVRVA